MSQIYRSEHGTVSKSSGVSVGVGAGVSQAGGGQSVSGVTGSRDKTVTGDSGIRDTAVPGVSDISATAVPGVSDISATAVPGDSDILVVVRWQLRADLVPESPGDQQRL